MSIKREIIHKNLGQILHEDEEDEPTVFNYKLRDDESNASKLEFRIPEHQRFPQWKKDKKAKLIGSILLNYPIHGFICSKHHHVHDDGSITEYYDIEDGQTRLSVIQEFYQSQDYQELYSQDKKKFMDYQITMEIITFPRNGEQHVHEIFDRLQQGQPLRDCDKYWNWKDKSELIKYTLALKDSDLWKHEYMGTKEFAQKKRDRLSDMVGLVSSIIHWDTVLQYDYISKAFPFHFPTLLNPINKTDIKKVEDFMKYYMNICDQCYRELPKIMVKVRKEKVRHFWHIGFELGMILLDWKQYNVDIKERTNMWVYYINMCRKTSNLVGPNQRTLWNGLSNSVTSNQKKYVKERVIRVRDFWNASKDPTIFKEFCDTYTINCIENSDIVIQEDDDED